MALQAIQPIHPFPARMAPEIALEESRTLRPGSMVLDPMAGSGTVLRAASEQGHSAVGCDTDPLAVLMARVWTTPIDPCLLRTIGTEMVARAREDALDIDHLPWLDDDQETQTFINYWFGPAQQVALRKLSLLLQDAAGDVGDALRLALSRIIITKDAGASFARDVSHSRPHRVRDTNDFDVLKEFERSLKRLAQRLEEQPPPGQVNVFAGDARHLDAIASGVVDAVITSPPYLNAIDYMRGHRFALVWLGHRLCDLRTVRAEAIGAERMASANADHTLARSLAEDMGPLDLLTNAQRRMVDRYVLDIYAMVSEMHRVVKPGGKAVLVVGNSCLKQVFVRNSQAVKGAAVRSGFELVKSVERDLPPSRRYLPPPSDQKVSDLENRMRTETILTFVRPCA
jgi:SAM-dependent methyltransferase